MATVAASGPDCLHLSRRREWAGLPSSIQEKGVGGHFAR